jgi:hypothetical protein
MQYHNETVSQSQALNRRQHADPEKGLDAEQTSPIWSGEVFPLDIAFYRTRFPGCHLARFVVGVRDELDFSDR